MPDGSYRWCGRGRARLTGILIGPRTEAGTRKPMGLAAGGAAAAESSSGRKS